MKIIAKLILGVFTVWLVVGSFVVIFLSINNGEIWEEAKKAIRDHVSYKNWESITMKGLKEMKIFDRKDYLLIQPALVPGVCWGYEWYDGGDDVITINLLSPFIPTGFAIEERNKVDSGLKDLGMGLNYEEKASFKFQVLGLNATTSSGGDTDDAHDYGTYSYEEDDHEVMQYFKVMNFTAKQYPVMKLKIFYDANNLQRTRHFRIRIHGWALICCF